MESALQTWYQDSGRDLPWRRTRDPYAILVSKVMLQQTQVERVLPRYLAWLERWPTVESLAAASALIGTMSQPVPNAAHGTKLFHEQARMSI